MSAPVFTCPVCGIRDLLGEGTLVPVWEDKEDFGDAPPDRIGCENCSTFLPFEHYGDESTSYPACGDVGPGGFACERPRDHRGDHVAFLGDTERDGEVWK